MERLKERRLIADDGAQRHVTVLALADAFIDDPAMRWMRPDEAACRRMLPHFFDHMRKEDLLAGRVIVAAGGEAAALWRAPGWHKEEPRGSLRTVMTFLTVLGTASNRGRRIATALAKHHPSEPHWHLRFLGVRVANQGQGWGGALLREGLARADSDGQPTYLETATPENVGLYQRFGFEVIDEWDVAGGGPHFWGMWRDAQPASG